jgi:RNA polymerase sigma-70 factor (ECF subfamily)
MEEIPLPLTPDALMAQKEWVQRVARALVLDESSAEDLAQQVWVRALERPPRVRRSIRAWLGTVLRNAATDLRRRDGRRLRREEAAARPEALPAAADVVARAEALQRVSKAALELREPYRTAILLRYFEDLSPADIARRQDVPLETVRSRLRRGLELLREALDADHDGDRRAWMLALLPFAIPWTGPLLPGSFRPVEPGAWSGADAAARVAGAAAKEILLMNVRAIAAAALALLLSAGAAWWILRELPGAEPGPSQEDAARLVAEGNPSSPRVEGGAGGGGGGIPTPPDAGGGGTPTPRDLTALPYVGPGKSGVPVPPDAGAPPRDPRAVADAADRAALLLAAEVGAGKPSPGSITVRGRVVDADTGQALEGMPLTVYNIGASPWRTAPAKSGADGTFEVAGVVPTSWTLIAGPQDSSSDYGHVTLHRTEAPDGEFKVALRKGLEIEGTILDADGALLTGDANVFAWKLTSRGDRVYESQRWVSAANGAFRLRGLEAGAHLLQAKAWSADPATPGLTGEVPSVDAGTKNVVIRLPRGEAVSGRVVDEEGKPVTGQGWVHASPQEQPVTLRKIVYAALPGDGTFRTPPLDPGTAYEVVAGGFEGLGETRLKDVKGGTADVTLVLRRTNRIAGTVVLEDGSPAPAGVPVRVLATGSANPGGARYQYGYTAPGGTFSLAGLANIEFRAVAGGGPSEYTTDGPGVTAKAGTTDVVLKVKKGVALQGKLLDADGNPVQSPHMNGTAKDGSGVTSWTRIEGSDGSFRLPGLPRCKVALTVTLGGKVVDLGEHEAPAEGLVLRLPKE